MKHKSTNSDIPRTCILGVEIDLLTFESAVNIILSWISNEGGPARYVVTPNVNHLVLHEKNQEFRRAYTKASMVLADGRYVVLLSKLFGSKLPEPISGSDLVPAIFSSASKTSGITVLLLGAMEGVAAKAATRIEERWPAVTIVGTYSPPIGFEEDEIENRKIRSIVNRAAPDLLVVGVSPPKQEIWISKNIHKLNVKVGICAGATIDFLAGVLPRAPLWMQRTGLEWIFRVVMEPRRLALRYASDGVAIGRLMVRELHRRRHELKE